MEKDIIEKWIVNWGSFAGSGSGDGSGSGNGYGSGSGSGDGSGYGSGSGSGDGSGDGFGYGCGYGDGDGSGSGSGDGFGYGSGYGDGSGSGSGDGFGYGSQIKKHTKRDVHYIDSIPTIIVSIFGNYAKGLVIREDTFELTKCYLAKDPVRGKVAHGDTLKEASVALYAKIMDSMTVQEKIESFCAQFEKGKKYKGKVFFDWHHILTGSCMFGRKQFVDARHLSLEDEYTVDQFIEICENAYGAEEIRKLKEKWN